MADVQLEVVTRSDFEDSHLNLLLSGDGWIHTGKATKKLLDKGNSEERHAKSLVRCPLPIHGVLSLITMTIRSHLTCGRGMDPKNRMGKTPCDERALETDRPQQWLVICFTGVTY